MYHENSIVHALRIYLYIFYQSHAFSKLSLILVCKENVHWFRNSFELVQLKQILKASCGYAMNLGLVRQRRDWKINIHAMFYEHLKRFSVWGPCDSKKASRDFIPCRPVTSKATRGCIPCRLVAGKSRWVIIPCRLASRKATRG